MSENEPPPPGRAAHTLPQDWIALQRHVHRLPAQNALLYHYTTVAGLIGIIETKTLWATQLQYLNDHKEFRHAIELASSEIEGLLCLPDVMDTPVSYSLRLMALTLTDLLLARVAVTSFCSEPDLLSQWRAYGTKTAGFAVGFRSDDLLQMVQRSSKDAQRLVRCVYEPDEQLEVVRAILAMALHTSPERPVVPAAAEATFRRSMVLLAASLKPSGFREEQEYRIVTPEIAPGDLHFRASDSIITPYVPLPFGRAQPVKILVGPTPHSEESQQSVRALLEKYGFHDTTVEASAIPYRNW
jgi:hypothetical protein